MNAPLVTVICLCYNHERFVQESIQSVLQQTYANVQLIVVDDGSVDSSVQVVEEAIEGKDILFLRLPQNVGNCKAFNQGLSHAKGAFVIDLAADDALDPDRIKIGVETFDFHGTEYGVHFSDAEIVAENGEHLSSFYDTNPNKELVVNTVDGDLFSVLLEKYLICPPTMMIKKEVLDQLRGYDETLAYEDFDFWVRSSRNWKYCFTDQVLVKKRQVEGSLGSKQYQSGNLQMESTYKVCAKAYSLCRTNDERKCLRIRVVHELKHAMYLFKLKLVWQYVLLLSRLL